MFGIIIINTSSRCSMSYYYSPRKEQERNNLNNAVEKFLQNNSITQLAPQENSFEYHLNAELERITYENIDDFKTNKRKASSIFDENDYELNSHLVGNTHELTANFTKPYQNPTPLAL